jgi:hypothetical protein
LAVNGDTAGLRYDVKVVVDGEQKGIISQAMTAFSQAVMRCFFSIENLEEKEHIIEIVCADTSGSKYWGIGAFDYVGRTEIEILSDKVLLLQNQVSNVYTKSEIDAKLQNISVGNINLDEYAKVADILTLLMGYETVSDLTIVLSQYQKVSDMLTLLNDYQRVSDIVNEHAGLATKEELQQFRSEILQSGNVVMFQNNDEIVKKLSAIAEILVLK